MSVKFWRAYQLEVMGQKMSHVISYPITCSFSLTRAQWSTLNRGTFSFTGLSKQKRDDIFFDRNTLQFQHIPIKFRAGYISNLPSDSAINFAALPVIFQGSVSCAYTERQGSEIITHIEAFDGGFAITNTQPKTPTTFQPGSYQTVMQQAMSLMEPNGVMPGKILISDNPPPAFTSAVSVSGNIMDFIRTYLPAGATVFSDMNTINILGQYDTLPSVAALATITSDTGLLNIPKKSGYIVEASLMFEPRLAVGQSIVLQTQFLASVNNKNYKVTGISHHGTISGSEAGKCVTDVTLFAKDDAKREVSAV